MPAAPGAIVVVDAAHAPVPSPAVPAPGLVVGEQCPDGNRSAEGDDGRGDDDTGAGDGVDDGGVVLWDVNDLRVSRLDDIDGLRSGLDLDHLLGAGPEGARGVGLVAEALDGVGDLSLVAADGLADGGVVVDVAGHHLEDGGEGDEGEEGRIVTLLLGGVGERGAGELRILRDPVGDVEDLLRIGRGGRDLGEQGVGIERDRGEELVELLGGGRRRGGGLGFKERREAGKDEKGDEQRYRGEAGRALHV